MAEEKKEHITLSACISPSPETARGYSVAINSFSTDDGDYIIYTKSRLVIIRDLADPNQSMQFTEHKSKCTVAMVSPDGELVASGDAGGQVIVWGRIDQQIKQTFGGLEVVKDISWSSDGKKLIFVGSGEGCKGRVIDLASGKDCCELQGHQKTILSCSFQPSETKEYKIITASEDNHVSYWGGESIIEHIKKERSHNNWINCVRYSPDGSLAVSVGSDKKIVVYDGKSNKKIKVLKDKKNEHKGTIYSFCWSPCSKYILTASADKTAKIWDISDGTFVKAFKWENDLGNFQVGALWLKGNEQEYLITISLSGSINYLDPESGEIAKSLPGCSGTPKCFSFDPQTRNILYCGMSNGDIMQTDGTTCQFSRSSKSTYIRDLSCSCDGGTLFCIQEKTLFSIETKTMEFGDGIEFNSHPPRVSAGKADPKLCAVAFGNNKIFIIKEGSIVSENDVCCEALTMDWGLKDKVLVVGTKKKTINTFDFDGTKLTKAATYKDKLFGAPTQIQNHGEIVSVSDSENCITIFQDGEVINRDRWRYHNSTVNSHAWNPDLEYCASVSLDLNLHVQKKIVKCKKSLKKYLRAFCENGIAAHWVDNTTVVTIGSSGMTKYWTITPWD